MSASLAPAAPLLAAAPAPLSLDGEWRVRLDPAHEGERRRWFAAPLAEAAPLRLPGSLEQAGLGERPGLHTEWTGSIFDRSFFTSPAYADYRRADNFKLPFWLQPETRHVGPAWYQREIEIPESWAGLRVELELERPHGFARVWLDEREVGACDSLSTPHRHELGEARPGRHRLTVLLDNDPRRVDLGENSHSISDHTQGNWHGVVGRLVLRATPRTWIDRVAVFPGLARRSARVEGRIAGAELATGEGRVTASATLLPADGGAPVALPPVACELSGERFSLEYPLGDYATTWDEFSPARYALRVELANGHVHETVFGLREVAVDGRRLLLNGRPLFVRATLDCAAFPRTGHPPTTPKEWRRILSVCRAHGLNALRFHSWCPPRAAFEVADELGFYCQVEVASWPGHTTKIGDGRPIDGWIDAETERIVREYGNHPSFVFLVMGNEPEGPRHRGWLADWVERRRARDPRHLVSAGSGWPNLPESHFLVDWRPRVQHWGAGLASRINSAAPETVTDYRDFIAGFAQPLVSHEIGQWCAYPNLAEIEKYTGYLKPRNFEIFRERLAASGLLELAPAFVEASGKLQTLCYKEDIESALRTPEMAGFHLLGLSDFPGQGTAPVGVLDVFYEEKGYVRPENFRRFCAETVPLARLPRRVFTTDETLVAELDLAHWGDAPLAAATLAWRLLGPRERVLASGCAGPTPVPLGDPARLGRVEIPLAAHAALAPARLRLEVALEGTAFVNDWDLWLYPAAVAATPPAAPAGVTLVGALDEATLAALEAGACVVACVPGSAVAGGVQLGFSSIFWNTAWSAGQVPHTLGILCDPAHPALAAFPTEAWSNWQWSYPIRRGGALVLDGLPRSLRPIVRVIDDWFTARSLALVIEARVGRGRLLLVAADLVGAEDPVCRQLLASLLAYAASLAFAPAAELRGEELARLLVPGAVERVLA
jgi:hypothetical protein